ncbi:VWA domain-containing protein [Archangium sp.]|uniref:VWA domain-containing protein n=1 Tax=Archangium sp. TaxID=1872627 RepID=UPI00286C8282|nr:VWA domain-containing protein [Archangium sp.]
MSLFPRPLAACLLLLLSVPGTALAEGDEVEHRVEGRVEGEHALLTVYRTLRNPAARYVEQRHGFMLPPGGTVHGFALQAQGQWTEGLLLANSESERRYEALRRRGTAAPRTLARLSGYGSGVELRLWNVPPRSSVTVRYDVRIRIRHAKGRSAFSYPLPWDDEAGPKPALTVAPPHPEADLRIEPGSALGQKLLEVSWKPRPLDGIDARAGLAPWDTGTLGFLQVRAGRLSEAPTRARVVFVVDASHSVGAHGVTQQLTRAGDYLQLLPDAVAEVILFRRSAERLFGRLIPASEWKAALAALPAARLETGNGSHLDEGLRLAQQVLAEGTGPARVLALTDGKLRRAFEPVPAAPSTSAPDTAVHLLMVGGRGSYVPPHEKLSERLVREACGGIQRSYEQDLEPLVRPVRWEQVHVEDDQGTKLEELGALGEGDGFQTWLPSPETPLRALVLRGTRWGCPASLPVAIDAALSADVGRTAYNWRVEPPPSEAIDLLAKSGDWVSPERSFLAVPPGAGPSSARTRALPDGVEGGVVGGVSGGVISCPLAGPRQREDAPKYGEELTRLLQPALSACSREAGGASLQVRVETTGHEVVDVEVEGAASENQAACVREASWALRLPSLFDDGFPGTYTVRLSP